MWWWFVTQWHSACYQQVVSREAQVSRKAFSTAQPQANTLLASKFENSIDDVTWLLIIVTLQKNEVSHGDA